MKITLGFSPCPNDTFIFDALVNQKIDTGGLSFDVILEDVESLNQRAMEGRLDITKLSFPAFFRSAENYILLDAGSALGKGVGPLLISKKPVELSSVQNSLIAIPGKHTTANLLLSYAFPDARHKKNMVFSAIEDAVLREETDLGLIIHENRFTYQQRGLHKVLDLGEYWEEKTGSPIPLGGIAARRSLGTEIISRVNSLIRRSLEYAFEKYPLVSAFTVQHAREMDEQVMRQHISLYVNNYSLSLGEEGRNAILKLQEVFNRLNPENKTGETMPLFPEV